MIAEGARVTWGQTKEEVFVTIHGKCEEEPEARFAAESLNFRCDGVRGQGPSAVRWV